MLAAVSIWVDSRLSLAFDGLPLMLSATVSGGRAIATTVAGATITVAAIVFSITALSTQMASSQYSPRALGGFFDDPFQQTIIGLVVGTFTYALLILAGLGSVITDPIGATPSLSVTLVILFGVLSVIGIVAYINHSLQQMQIDTVVRRIADSALVSIRRALNEPGDSELSEAPPPEGESLTVTSNRTGWIVGIDTSRLVAGLPKATSVRIGVRIGEAVSESDHIATLWPDPENTSDDVEQLIRKAIHLAPKRSIATDPTFGIRQLVDIALKALSPGINDPTTAVDVLHHLKIPVREVLVSDPPRRVFTGTDDRRVYLAETPSRSDYVHMAFSEIRLAAGTQLSVIEALIEVLQDLRAEMADADLGARAAAIEKELRLTVEMARASGLPEDDLMRVIGQGLLSEDGDLPDDSDLTVTKA